MFKDLNSFKETINSAYMQRSVQRAMRCHMCKEVCQCVRIMYILNNNYTNLVIFPKAVGLT